MLRNFYSPCFLDQHLGPVSLFLKMVTSPELDECLYSAQSDHSWAYWRWLGHAIRKDRESITRAVLRWTPDSGRRKRGRPRQTWRRTIEAEMKTVRKTWKELEKTAMDREQWKSLVSALCATWAQWGVAGPKTFQAFPGFYTINKVNVYYCVPKGKVIILSLQLINCSSLKK